MAQDRPNRRFALTSTNTNSPSAVLGFGGNSYGFAVTERRFFGSVIDDVVASGVNDRPVNSLTGSIAITGYAPTVAQTANNAVAPAVGSLAIMGYAPSVNQSATTSVLPGVGSLTVTGLSPTIGQTANQSVSPSAGSISLTGFAPVITQGAGQTVSPVNGALVVIGFAPTVARTANQAVAAGVGTIALTGYAPTVTTTAGQVVAPSTGAIVLTGYPPIVAQSNVLANSGAGKRRILLDIRGRIEEFETQTDADKYLADIEPKEAKSIEAKAQRIAKAVVRTGNAFTPKPLQAVRVIQGDESLQALVNMRNALQKSALNDYVAMQIAREQLLKAQQEEYDLSAVAALMMIM